MGIDHSFKDESSDTKRCPICHHVSTLKGGSDENTYGIFNGPSGEYFYCQNPNCKVERIYGDNAVMVTGNE